MTQTIAEQLEGKIPPEIEDKWRKAFEQQSQYFGNGIYGIPERHLYSTDPRELALMFYAQQEGIPLHMDEEDEEYTLAPSGINKFCYIIVVM